MEKIIGFWKPNQKYGEFSQWWKNMGRFEPKYQFCDEDYMYICAEQYMMAQKALLFNDRKTFDEIMHEDDPAELKALGRKIKNFNSTVWDEAKFNIVCQGNEYKFYQNEDLAKKLLDTGDAILCEASPYDKIWGIGMDINHPKFKDPTYWEGENLLGKALMVVREMIKKTENK